MTATPMKKLNKFVLRKNFETMELKDDESVFLLDNNKVVVSKYIPNHDGIITGLYGPLCASIEQLMKTREIIIGDLQRQLQEMRDYYDRKQNREASV